MGTARSVLFTFSSIIMIFSGAGGICLIPFMLFDRSASRESSFALILMCSALVFIYSVLNIISGIKSLKYASKRSNSAVVIRIPQICVFLCLFCLIISFFNGISALHMIIIIATGIVIPDIFMFAAIRKSYE